MNPLFIHQGELEAYIAKTQTAIDRAQADVDRLTELEAQHAKLSANRQDKVAAAFLANTVADTQAIDAELDTVAKQIAALSDSKATHALLLKQLADVEKQADTNQRHINRLVCNQMQERFEQGEQEFAAAVVKLGNALVKMQSALIMTRMAKVPGRIEIMRDQYRNYVGDGFYVRGLARIAERDLEAEKQAAEMLENLRNEGVIL
ncbi:MAG: hypothetical protein WC685_07575 [Methylobacter sp.]|jgi:hypothetical protein